MRVRIFHHQSPVDKINVTPLIDVVMVLIVFYLIVGKLATDSAARVELPRATGAQQQDRGSRFWPRRPVPPAAALECSERLCGYSRQRQRLQSAAAP